MIYLKYWGLKKPPFTNEPDPELVYFSDEFEEALSRLRYAIKRNKGAALLTGETGCGKTTLLATLAGSLPANETCIVLVNGPFSKPIEFFKETVRRFGSHHNHGERKSDFLRQIQSRIDRNTKDKMKTVFLIDDAEGLSKETLEEVGLLLNVLSDQGLPATMIFSGQPALRNRVGELKDLDQRTAMRCRLGLMNFEDTTGYISHRLKAAGAVRRIFTFEAMVEIHSCASGIPLMVNEFCDLCLEKGYGSGASVIGVDIVHGVN